MRYAICIICSLIVVLGMVGTILFMTMEKLFMPTEMGPITLSSPFFWMACVGLVAFLGVIITAPYPNHY